MINNFLAQENSYKINLLESKVEESAEIADLDFCEINDITLGFYLALSEIYPEPCGAFQMERIAKIVNGWIPLTFFAKSSVLDVWLGSEYVSVYLGFAFFNYLQLKLLHWIFQESFECDWYFI